jgi:hypothetical protein
LSRSQRKIAPTRSADVESHPSKNEGWGTRRSAGSVGVLRLRRPIRFAYRSAALRMTRCWWLDYCVRDGSGGGAIPLRPRRRKSDAPFSLRTHRPCSLRRKQSQGQRTGVSALHDIGFGENALTLRAECWKCRGPFGFAQGRLFDFAGRFASRIGLLRSG